MENSLDSNICYLPEESPLELPIIGMSSSTSKTFTHSNSFSMSSTTRTRRKERKGTPGYFHLVCVWLGLARPVAGVGGSVVVMPIQQF